MAIEIKSNRKDDLLEDALSDSFFQNLCKKKTKPENKQSPKSKLPYQNVCWCMKEVPKRKNGMKSRYSYNTPLPKVESFSDPRLPTPQEYMSLMIAYYENTLEKSLIPVAEDILLPGGGEFTCHALYLASTKHHNGIQLISVYEFVTGLKSDKRSFHASETGDWFMSKKDFTISFSGRWINLHTLQEFSRSLVEYLYTRKVDDLPKEMQGAEVYLPAPGTLQVIGVNYWSLDKKIGNISAKEVQGAKRLVIPK